MTVATQPTESGTERAGTVATTDTANDRFKRGFGNWYWRSLIAATFLHFVAFLVFPSMGVSDVSYGEEALESVELPDDIEIPPPPEQIARPATPVVAEANIDQDVTIAETDFESNPIENLPPPPNMGNTGGQYSDFVPTSVRPELLNKDEVSRTLKAEYPTLLRDAGVEGRVVLYLWIEQIGRAHV